MLSPRAKSNIPLSPRIGQKLQLAGLDLSFSALMAIKLNIVNPHQKINRDDDDAAHVEYEIRVLVPDEKLNYVLHKRYNEFYELYHTLEKDHEMNVLVKNLPQFPGKKLFGKLDKDFVQQRMTGLNDWLQAAKDVPSILCSLTFIHFLDLHYQLKEHRLSLQPRDPTMLYVSIVRWRETSRLDGGPRHVEYEMKVKIGNMSWKMERRFSEFLSLSQNIIKTYALEEVEKLAPFPPKKVLGKLKAEFVHKRLTELRLWLASLLTISNITDDKLVQMFLDSSGMHFKKWRSIKPNFVNKPVTEQQLAQLEIPQQVVDDDDNNNNNNNITSVEPLSPRLVLANDYAIDDDDIPPPPPSP